MSQGFPNDLTVEILLKLPVKSLLRFKCIHKSWRSLIQDSQFIKLYHNRCKGDINCQKILVGCSNANQFNFYSIDATQFQHGSVVSLTEHLPEAHHPIGEPLAKNSRNGLFLLRSHDSHEIVLWNPTIGESRRIPSTNLTNKGKYSPDCCLYGIGYVSSTDDYKIVSVGSRGEFDEFEIFSTKSNSWKLVTNKNFPSNIYVLYRDLVVLDEIVYMVAFTDQSQDASIVSFCLEKEQFQEVTLFPDGLSITEAPVLFALGGEKLCLTRKLQLHFAVEVWCMTKNGNSSSWSKICNLPLGGVSTKFFSPVSRLWLTPLTFMEDGDLLFFRYTGEFVVYSSKTRKFKQVDGLRNCFVIGTYVQSCPLLANSFHQDLEIIKSPDSFIEPPILPKLSKLWHNAYILKKEEFPVTYLGWPLQKIKMLQTFAAKLWCHLRSKKSRSTIL